MSARKIVLVLIGYAALLHGETVRLPHRAGPPAKPAAAVVHAPAKLPEAAKLPAPAVPLHRKIEGGAAGARGAFALRGFHGARPVSPSNVFLPSTPSSTGLPHRGPYAAVLGGSVSTRTAAAGGLAGSRVKHKF